MGDLSRIPVDMLNGDALGRAPRCIICDVVRRASRVVSRLQAGPLGVAFFESVAELVDLLSDLPQLAGLGERGTEGGVDAVELSHRIRQEPLEVLYAPG